MFANKSRVKVIALLSASCCFVFLQVISLYLLDGPEQLVLDTAGNFTANIPVQPSAAYGYVDMVVENVDGCWLTACSLALQQHLHDHVCTTFGCTTGGALRPHRVHAHAANG